MVAAGIFSEKLVGVWLFSLGLACWNRLAETNVRFGVVVGAATGSSIVACYD
jgi:hypothetical protein